MNINLRKAKSILTEINNAINGLPLATTVAIGEFDSAKSVIDKAQTVLSNNFKSRYLLRQAESFIRQNIGRLNASVGVSDILAYIATIDKDIRDIQTLLSSSDITNIEVIKAKQMKLQKQETSTNYYASDLVASIVSAEYKDTLKGQLNILKKQKISLADSLLDLNVKTEFGLTTDIEQILQNHNIL
jgi:hypothetical protein